LGFVLFFFSFFLLAPPDRKVGNFHPFSLGSVDPALKRSPPFLGGGSHFFTLLVGLAREKRDVLSTEVSLYFSVLPKPPRATPLFMGDVLFLPFVAPFHHRSSTICLRAVVPCDKKVAFSFSPFCEVLRSCDIYPVHFFSSFSFLFSAPFSADRKRVGRVFWGVAPPAPIRSWRDPDPLVQFFSKGAPSFFQSAPYPLRFSPAVFGKGFPLSLLHRLNYVGGPREKTTSLRGGGGGHFCGPHPPPPPAFSGLGVEGLFSCPPLALCFVL